MTVLVALFAAALWVGAASAQDNALAVLDFDASGNYQEVDSWAVGLADFFAAALQERGVVLLERRNLRYVLAERQLSAAALADPTTIAKAQLPWVRFLLKGTISEEGSDRFRVTVSATDTRAGVEVWSAHAQGAYPDELATTVERLADELLEALPQQGRVPADGEPILGFTSSPDVALLFYRGLEHYGNGRAEFAAEYFRNAWLADQSFWLAAIWRIRSLEALGLGDLAETVRALVLANPDGRRAFASLASTYAHRDGRLVVSVAVGEDEGVGRDFRDAVQTHLLDRGDITVFSSDWVGSLAKELDLELSGWFPPHALRDQPWLVADAVVRATVVTGDAGHQRYRIELVDALRGTLLARVEQDVASFGVVSPALGLVTRLFDEHPSAAGAVMTPPLAPLDYDLPAGDLGIYTVQRYAWTLRAFADDPTDFVRLTQHFVVHDRHSHAEYVPGTFDVEWPYLEQLLYTLRDGIRDDDPDAALWWSHVLWHLRFRGNLGDANRDDPRVWFNHGKRIPPLEEHFAPLLERHADHFVTQCVRYSIALREIADGRHAPAATLLRELARTIPQSRADLHLSYGANANLYYFAAREAHREGATADARLYALKAAECARAFERYASPAAEAANRPVTNVITTVQPVVFAVAFTAPGLGNGSGGWNAHSMPKTIVEDGQLLFRPEQSLNDDIQNLLRELDGKATETTLAKLHEAAVSDVGTSGVEVRLRFLRRVVREARAGLAMDWHFYYVDPKQSILPWLIEHAGHEERATTQRLVLDLVAALREHPTSYHIDDRLEIDLYRAAAMNVEIAAVVEAKLRSDRYRDRSLALVTRGESLRLGGKLDQAARFLERELRRFEEDFPEVRDRYYLDVVYPCAQLQHEAGLLRRAAATYDRTLEQRLCGDSSNAQGREESQQHRASLRFRWSEVEEALGNLHRTAELLTQVIELSQTHPDWLVHYSGSAARSVGTLTMHRAAVRRLEDLRSTVPTLPRGE